MKVNKEKENLKEHHADLIQRTIKDHDWNLPFATLDEIAEVANKGFNIAVDDYLEKKSRYQSKKLNFVFLASFQMRHEITKFLRIRKYEYLYEKELKREYGVTGNVRIDINDLEDLSRKVGYFNNKVNVDQDDEKLRADYEHLRSKQLKFMTDIIEHYEQT